MTYKETMELADKHGIKFMDLLIAQECDWAFGFYYTDEQFEKLCEKTRYVYGRSRDAGVDVSSIAQAINHLIEDNNDTIDEVLNMDFYDIHDVALNYCEY